MENGGRGSLFYSFTGPGTGWNSINCFASANQVLFKEGYRFLVFFLEVLHWMDGWMDERMINDR